MIQLYTWKTPNGRKPAILLEELGVPYTIIPIDLSKQAQFEESFLKVSPNNKIPGLVDNDVISRRNLKNIFLRMVQNATKFLNGLIGRWEESAPCSASLVILE